MWFGLLGPAGAWVGQHLVGIGSTLAQCDPAGTRWHVALHTVIIAATIAAALVALLGWIAAIAVVRLTQPGEDVPPAGRVRFLGIVAATTSPLFLLIIIWSGIGSTVLQECRQG